ncbi:type I-E CRISPR-associated protein Cas6/Cse3/CasE [Bifidobacterium cuniculi]|uniref:CRISPR-associated protein, Cse3 family n=1 Tax=Bifidobacterium cuniculi TaxID=1688 RepID=A0A087AT72_9BIFI|nr:type I-E CRISPR-associated protein Cas6/Cse3/CasE [Bifidobacterium cuniculi]KFI61972.1 CRISPR-associated protein, Cse3 family [Bifidobacterium cuniculi]
MTFFSRVMINPMDRHVLRVGSSLQRMHAVLAKATDAQASNQRTLWRLDRGLGSAWAKLYIVSAEKPKQDILQAELGIRPADMACTEYEPFLSKLECGQEWGFRITANPTHSIMGSDGVSRGARKPLVKRDDQEQWLCRQLRKSGCHVTINRLEQPELRIQDVQQTSFGRRTSTVTLTRVTYEGLLSIDDADSLRRTMLEGIGPAKAYGCGLLTLAPLAPNMVKQH